mgnify:CR=1 FL=1
MRWSDLGEENCPVARALSVVGDRWTLLILRECFFRVRRFEDFQTRLGITRPVLSERLHRLIEDGVLMKRLYQERPLRHEYVLTEKGKALSPVLTALLVWGNEHMRAPGEPVYMQLRHQPCGHVVTPITICPDCGEVLTPQTVHMAPSDPEHPLNKRAQ